MRIGNDFLAYRESGRGDTVVLVHGNVSDLRSWDVLERLLARDFHVVNYSRRFAYPNRPAEADTRDTFATHVDDLVALIERLGRGSVHLVGNSSGAFVALLVAQRRPDLVRTLTLEEPPVVSMFLQALPPRPAELFTLLFTSPGALVELIKFGAGVIAPATKAFRAGNDHAAIGIFARGVLGEAAYSKLSESRKQQMMDNAAAHRSSLLGAGLPVFTASEARAIETPTQLVHGSHSPAFQRRINRRLASLIPGARDVGVPSASHLVHEDNPEAVARAVAAFCKANG